MSSKPLAAIIHPAHPDVPRVEEPTERRALGWELALILVVTFGYQGIISLLSLIQRFATGGLRGRSVEVNPTYEHINELINLTLQALPIIRLLAWAGLASYLLWRSGIAARVLGHREGTARSALLWGAALAAVIGLPGLALMDISVRLGLNLAVIPATGFTYWWEAPVLLASAAANAAAEEIIVTAWLMARLRQLGMGSTGTLVLSALLRASYHLYQGVGAAVGNFIMGLVFGRLYQATGRVVPLIVGHFLIDAVAFVGFALFREQVIALLPWLAG